VLDGETAPMVLSLAAGALQDPRGARFTPLIPPVEDSPARPAPDTDGEP
jgi:hypothetical protein